MHLSLVVRCIGVVELDTPMSRVNARLSRNGETASDAASGSSAWAAFRDWGAPHQRLVPGFAVDTRLDGRDRLVTFFTGVTVRELLVDLDEKDRRLVWSVVDGPYTQLAGSLSAPAGT